MKRWIDGDMANRSCVGVLTGSQTAERKWVHYEMKKAW
ncbi:MAG: TIR domain-containing protein [Deltaproteobacteria bacterium]|nr:TIR domain-containing protein [Deltaproteobacteria bacterium]